MVKRGKPLDWTDPTLLRNVDIWRVRLPDGASLRCDLLFPGKASWIEQPVPRRNLSLVRYWPLARSAWHFLREARLGVGNATRRLLTAAPSSEPRAIIVGAPSSKVIMYLR